MKQNKKTLMSIILISTFGISLLFFEYLFMGIAIMINISFINDDELPFYFGLLTILPALFILLFLILSMKKLIGNTKYAIILTLSSFTLGSILNIILNYYKII